VISCKDLFSGIETTIIGDENVSVKGIAYRPDKVQPGDAFFCIVGLKADGHTFAQDAIDHGAKVLVVQRKLYLADASDVTEVVVDDTRKVMALASANFYGHPSQSFDLVGITGTNGKTTSTFLVNHICSVAGKKSGLIGTIGVHMGSKSIESARTTPESSDLQHIFADMRDDHCDTVVMEVSSIALDLKRTYGTRFKVTAFTNLTRDHLDYHKTFQTYFEAKALLFGRDYPARRVICIDDEWGQELLRRCSEAQDQVITTGFARDAQIHPEKVTYHPTHTDIVLDVRGNQYSFSYPLVGKFNVSNIMTAFGCALQLGISAGTIVDALESAPQVPGRMERVHVPNDNGISVYVDYSHTPDALTKAIAATRELTKGHVIVVFGCGGDRDTTKRPIMGKAALDADYAVVTSDNPRTEDPQEIIREIVSGMEGGEGKFEVEPDRARAIGIAIHRAKPGDSILIAGKGHETYQILGTKTIHFSDVEVASKELKQAFGD